MRARRLTRDLAHRLAVLSGWPARRRRRLGATVFSFHDVAGDDCDLRQSDRSLHVRASEFEAYATWLASSYDVVPLLEITSRLADGRPLDGLAAITFDDAYLGVFRHAVPLLRARALPATVFVVTRASDAPGAFWWDALAENGEVPAETRERCLTTLQGDAARVFDAHPSARAATLPDELLPASWAQIGESLGNDEQVALESHTHTHRALDALSAEEIRRELTASRARLAEFTGREPAMIAYPYGRFGAEATRLARDAGYAAGFSIASGCVRAGADALALPRVNVPAGIGLDALECRAAGIGPRREA